ncbi:MAG TPA: hypothetical protein VHT75_12685 [Acidimicrobiales bacterium]|nr:hypothetical protein [Acidimicrobiales bacterium]
MSADLFNPGSVSPGNPPAEGRAFPPETPVRHRADYILERGVWHVACRVCGWRAWDPMRRRLASRFRFHLQGEPQDGVRGGG